MKELQDQSEYINIKDGSPKKNNVGTSLINRENDELRKSEERYHKMIEEVEDYAILMLNREGIVQNWNKGAEKIKGYKESEIVGKSFRLFYLPEDREKKLPEKLIEEAVRNGKAIHEGWRMRKDGSKFWGSIVITALHDEERNVIGFSKVTRDLTEIKAAADQITHYAQELESQNKELQQFTYAAAHDMKEPLRKVQFYNSMILESASDKLSDQEKAYLKYSVNSVTRMSGLIDDLLRYSETSDVFKKFEGIEIIAIIKDIAVFFQDSLYGGSIEFQGVDSAIIWGIPFQIQQLFENIIGNAIKYRKKDSPQRIQIACSEEFRQMESEPGEFRIKAYYKITIRDNGIGFEQEYADKIFGLFHRLHSRVEYPGTGVGLAICKKIVLNHNGSIEANSSPGEGTTFTIYLPCL